MPKIIVGTERMSAAALATLDRVLKHWGQPPLSEGQRAGLLKPGKHAWWIAWGWPPGTTDLRQAPAAYAIWTPVPDPGLWPYPMDHGIAVIQTVAANGGHAPVEGIFRHLEVSVAAQRDPAPAWPPQGGYVTVLVRDPPPNAVAWLEKQGYQFAAAWKSNKGACRQYAYHRACAPGADGGRVQDTLVGAN